MSAGFDACNVNAAGADFLAQAQANAAGEVIRVPSNTAAMEDSVIRSVAADQSSNKSAAAKPQSSPHSLQRVAEARKQQGFSLRTISRRTGIDMRTLRAHESPAADLKLSELHAWQMALEVPMVDLIEDESQPLSRPVRERATLVRIMKTAVALKEAGGTARIQRLADMLCEQLVELMPELADIGGWPQHGSRRPDNSSRMLEQQIDVSALRLD